MNRAGRGESTTFRTKTPPKLTEANAQKPISAPTPMESGVIVCDNKPDP